MDYNKDYYKELGLNKDATDDDIKKTYRKLAHQYHPDKNNGDKDSELKFQKINEANSILSDTKTKQEYDTRSPHGKAYSPNPFGAGFEFHFGNGASDIFSQFFGGANTNPFGNFGGFGNPFQQREEFRENLDINISSTINLKQIYLNENLSIKYYKLIHCDDCKGTGFDIHSKSDQCEVCNGTGKNNGQTCEYCMGNGKIHSGQCKKCKGEKLISKEAEVNIGNVFQLRNNVRNAYRGYGHQSKYYRDKVGSLILNINIDRNDDFQVNGNELHKTIDVHFQDAIDGNEILYTHIDDTQIKIKLPTKTNNNNIIRIKDKGLLNGNTRADLYLKINILIDYERI